MEQCDPPKFPAADDGPGRKMKTSCWLSFSDVSPWFAEPPRNKRDLSWLAHPDKTSLVLAGQSPEKSSDVGAFVKEADGVDAHTGAIGQRAIPGPPQQIADVLGKNFRALRFLESVLLRRQAGAGIG